MVRQLASTEHGVPIELYFFVNDIRWEYYEGIVSGVFDHLFAATKYFDLEIFENPASDDFRQFQETTDQYIELVKKEIEIYKNSER